MIPRRCTVVVTADLPPKRICICFLYTRLMCKPLCRPRGSADELNTAARVIIFKIVHEYVREKLRTTRSCILFSRKRGKREKTIVTRRRRTVAVKFDGDVLTTHRRVGSRTRTGERARSKEAARRRIGSGTRVGG